MKRVKYIGKETMNYIVENNDMDLIPGKVYDVVKETDRCYAVVDDENCVGCGLCAKICPAGCISSKERSEVK